MRNSNNLERIRRFFPAISAALRGTCQEVRASYALGLTTTSSSLGPLNPGIYLVFLDGLDPIRTVVLKVGDSRVQAERPANGSRDGRDSVLLPGSTVERIRVLPGRQHVAAFITQGTGTLYLVPLVTT